MLVDNCVMGNNASLEGPGLRALYFLGSMFHLQHQGDVDVSLFYSTLVGDRTAFENVK